ncbi:hypothetical protein OVN20_07300 [Microcella daejeonensis]|uniref:hypothetical protein n=1 Tax=Microcella daejeonensis TaxID=2994971 RepID=UPI00227056E1|nr:hypothetical protein [Microcella daejeonensis]WAB82920.1 hypothetical protein OVN20_07300 [Microcella daejeonensis]
MNENDFDLRVERVRKAAEVISALPSKALQAEAFRYLLEEKASSSTAPKPSMPTPAAPKESQREAGDKKLKRSTNKAAISWDRNLELFPGGKTSFKDFAAEKAPTNNEERYAVAAYWLREVAQVGGATVPQVVACYRVAEWSLPSNVANAASQAVKKGYLSSGKADDLQLSSIGINLVEKTLPRAKS